MYNYLTNPTKCIYIKEPPVQSCSLSSIRLKVSYGIHKTVQIIRVIGDLPTILCDHISRTDSVQILDLHVQAVLHAQYLCLTCLPIALVTARRTIVVEEAVETCPIDEHIAGAHES